MAAGLSQKIRDHGEGLAIWGILILNMMLVFVQRLYIGVMPDFLMEKLGIGIGQLAGLTSATFYGYAFFQIPSGVLIDRIGIRKLNFLGAGIACAGSFLFATARVYPLAYIARFLIGIGTAAVIISIMKVQVLWFEAKYFSQLSAVMAFFSSLGSIAGSLPLAILIGTVGAQMTLHIITGLSFLMILLIAVYVRDKERREEETVSPKKSVLSSIREVMTNKWTYPPLFMGLFFISTTTSLTGVWVVQFLMKGYGMDKLTAAGYLLYFSLGFMAGSPLVSFVDRRLEGDYKKQLNIFTFLYLLLWGYFIFLCRANPPAEQLPILFFLMGVFIMFHLLPFTAIKEANAIENSGIATSVTNTMEFIGSGILNVCITALIYRGYSIGESFVVIFLFAALSFISSLFIRRVSC
ncbi:MAG: MFS transporter [Peptostreptococcaceae bacterium]|nr:MFS transporter [Peptostreptococcaceae bacterium]